MTAGEIAQVLGFETLATGTLETEGGGQIARAHASDLLSDVLANAPAGGLLLTIQVHMNVVAVAVHAGLAGVIFTSGMKPEAAVIGKAAEENIRLFATKERTFDVAGKLFALGIRGSAGG
jgi:hypothetical protein